MVHKEMMGMITSTSSWEQVIYDVIAWEGLDPWDIDLKKLAEGFLVYVQKLEEMDFKVPAKFVMVVSTLLRMKSDHLPFLEYLESEEMEMDENGVSEVMVTEEPALNPLTIPPRRMPERKIVVSELVSALRKVMGSANRRTTRKERAKSLIKIKEDMITKRISSLYDKINSILGVRGEEVAFSTLIVDKSKRGVTDTFLPLVFLDHSKKVNCRQEEIFDEIYVKKGERGIEKFAKPKKRIKQRKTKKRKVNKGKKIKRKRK